MWGACESRPDRSVVHSETNADRSETDALADAGKGLRCPTVVAMVEAADLRDGNDPADRGSRDRRDNRFHSQRSRDRGTHGEWSRSDALHTRSAAVSVAR